MLIHWAAYNDLPEVLAEYARQGSNMNEVDTNGNTPVEIAVNNKSYRSAKVLAELGCQPKPETLENSGSKYLQKLFAYQKEPESNKR